MNLYIVESPLQLLCAYESILSSKTKYRLVVRLTSRGNNDTHLLSCLNLLDLEYEKLIVRPGNIKADILKNFYFLTKILFCKYKSIYIGSYYSKLLNFFSIFFNKNSIYYLDDGAATLRAQKEVLERNKSVNWYTFFEFKKNKKQKVIKHQFRMLTNKISKKSQFGVYFIGQPVEYMKNLSSEEYVEGINILANNTKGEKIFYIPHRLENIEHIKKLNNIVILNIEVPLELFFMYESDCFPREVYSYYSTALFTLKSIIPNVACKAIKINSNERDFLDIYESMESQGIELIDLNRL